MSFLTPRPSPCPVCNGGRISMCDCEKCAGTGRVFHIEYGYYADTADGFRQASEALERASPDLFNG